MENNSESPKDNKTWIIIVSVVWGVIVLSTIIILIIIYKKKLYALRKYISILNIF